jgi:hypothetical protein
MRKATWHYMYLICKVQVNHIALPNIVSPEKLIIIRQNVKAWIDHYVCMVIAKVYSTNMTQVSDTMS